MIKFPPYFFWPAYKFEFEHRQLIATYGSELGERHLHEALGEVGLEKRHWDTYCAARDAVTFTDLSRDELLETRSRQSPGIPLLDALTDDEATHAIFNEMMDLRKRDRQIIVKRYGLVQEEMTLQECADHLGLSRERVRQIQTRGENELRNALCFKCPEFFENEVRDTVNITSFDHEKKR